MHYQGTTRMGDEDDGTSVCAQDGRVWGTSNVFVAGNGLISTMTATNPTLTSVAHALRTATSVLRLLDT
jgi:choline dehydrogenase-like flavoprotein